MKTKDPITNRNTAEVTFDNVSFVSKEGKETGRETSKDTRSKSGKLYSVIKKKWRITILNYFLT